MKVSSGSRDKMTERDCDAEMVCDTAVVKDAEPIHSSLSSNIVIGSHMPYSKTCMVWRICVL